MRKIEVILNPKIGRFLNESSKRINVIYGGAGSGKSFTVAQHLLINKFYREKDIRILVVRKTLPALRITAYQLVLDLLEEYGLPYMLNKSEMTISIRRNRMLFKSLDDEQKIKCFHPDTDILTSDGFKPVKDIKKGLSVASMDPETREVTYRPVDEAWEYDYQGKMIEAGKKWERIAFSVTPNHKILGRTERRKELRFIEAKNLPARFFIPRESRWSGKKIRFYEIKDFNKHNQGKITTFPIIPWLKFLGWYLSEGCLGEGTRYMIYISQTKKEGRDEIREILDKFSYKSTETKRGFQLSGKALYNYLSQFGKCHQKFIPRDILDLHPDLLVHLFEALINGDGRQESKRRYTYCSNSEQLIDDMSELAIKLGYTPSIIKRYPVGNGYYLNGRPYWNMSICKYKDSMLDKKQREIFYEGKIYGFSVSPYHTVLARYKGRTGWFGQSYEGNYVWVEEASEISHKDFMQLNLRLRRQTKSTNQMFLTFNPINEYHWLNKTLVQGKRKDTAINQSTYKDNPFIGQTYMDELEGLKNEDATYYQIYALGEWGVLKNVIYTNYEIVKGEDWPGDFDEKVYGLDFGFNNPSALVEVCFKDQMPYLRERLYKTGLTNADLIAQLDMLIESKSNDIYADSAEPARIEEIARIGFNIYSSNKEVKDGLDFVKRKKLYIHEDSVNLIDEIRGYKYKETKDGVVLEEPVKFRDHICDAFRYALYTHGSEAKADFWVVDTEAK